MLLDKDGLEWLISALGNRFLLKLGVRLGPHKGS
jgi:hypothetical protein